MNSKAGYRRVSTSQGLDRLMRKCAEHPTALDFETTSLHPDDGRVRLVSLCNEDVRALVDFDPMGGFEAVAEKFSRGRWVVFHVGFEARWFQAAGVTPTLWDVGNMRRAILGGGSFSLAKIALWDLEIVLDKEEQRSDWSASKLRQEQLDYAFRDAEVTWQLWKYWSEQADAGRWRGFHTLNDMWSAVLEMEDSGMLLDPKAHKALVQLWCRTKIDREKTIRALVSESEVANIRSDSQWSDYFSALLPEGFLRGWPRTLKTGQLSMTTETLRALSARLQGTPTETFLDALSDYKTLSKYVSSFGESLISAGARQPDKRVRARFNVGFAKTGRFSSSGPNLQQIPRDRELLGVMTQVRRSFIAGMGRQLVALDYSGIELRVLALLSEDEQRLDDVVHGDVHAEVASQMAGRKIDKSQPADKALRSKAKAVSFGIIYGSGAGGLSVTMKATPDTAQGYIDFWSRRYAKAFDYRYQMLEEARKTGFLRCADGGTIHLGKKPDLPKCANYPVQRAALSVMARAIVRHKTSLDTLRASGTHRMSKLLATIHDALIDETATTTSEELLEVMKTDMVSGYLDIFPAAPVENLVEGGVGKNWSELG